MNRRVLAAGLIVVVPLLAILLLNLGRNPQAMFSPLVGRPAPPFVLTPVGGGDPVSLAGLKGKPVVLNFWSTWCVPCLEEHGVLLQAARARPDVQFFGVVHEDREDAVSRFLQQRGSAYPSLMDPASKTAIAYGVYGVPETFFIDADGVVSGKATGPVNPESLASHIAKAAAPRTANAGTR